MTRAQKFQWYLEKGHAEGILQLPDSTTDAVRSLVEALERQFEILRTSIDAVDGELRQKLHGSGSPLVVVDVAREGYLNDCVAGLVQEFRKRRLGGVGQLLVQFYLLRGDDRQWLAVIADNVAVDAGFHHLLNEETARLLAGSPDTAPSILNGAEGLQPSDVAALELSPTGEGERAEAAAYLRRHFSTGPPRMHSRRPSSGKDEGRYYRCTLRLRGADHIFASIISRTGLLPSASILAAFAQLMCWRSGKDSCAINVSVDNRHNRTLRHMLCATAQRVPVALPSQASTLLEAAADVFRALSDGHPTHGRYDPFDLLLERARAQHRRGVCLNTDLAFNFVPPPQGWTALMGSDTAEIDGGAADSQVGWETTDEVFYEYGASLSVRWSDPRSARLSIHGDADVLAAHQCAVLLRGIELMLNRLAAGRDCVVGEVAEEIGLRQRIGTAWSDHEAIKRRLLNMDGVDRAEIIADPRGGGARPRLVARVAVASGSATTPFDLREELLDAVDTGEIVVVPDCFEIIGGRPAAEGENSSVDGREIAPRPDTTAEEAAIRSALDASSGPASEWDLDRCYVRAGGRLARYPEFAARLHRLGYVPPDFAVVGGMRTLRRLARELRRSEPSVE
jgi:hypothetical protein